MTKKKEEERQNKTDLNFLWSASPGSCLVIDENLFCENDERSN